MKDYYPTLIINELPEDEEGDEEQEETVDEPSQGLCSHISVAVLVIGLPLGDHCRYQSSHQTWDN